MRPQTRKVSRTKAGKASSMACSEPPVRYSSITGEAKHRSSKKAAMSSVVSSLDNLPIEVVQVIGSKLAVQDLKTCRLVCKLWAERIAQGVTNVSFCMHPDTADAGRTLQHIRRLMPVASAFCIHVSNRQPQASADFVLQELHRQRHMRELQLVFRGQPGHEVKWPALGTVRLLKSHKLMFGLTQLTSLTIQDNITPTNEIPSITSLKALTKLAFTSSDNFKTATLDYFRGAMTEDIPGALASAHMVSICSLRNLRHLEVPVSRAAADHCTLWGLAQLSKLTCLVTHGHPFRFSCLDGAGKFLALGLPDKTIAMPPNLEELSMPWFREVQPGCGLALDQPGSKLRNVSLTMYSYLDTTADLTYMAAKLAQKLRTLVFRTMTFALQDAMLLGELQQLQHLDVYLMDGRMPFSDILANLKKATQLQTVVLAKRMNTSPPKDANLHSSLAMLAGVAEGLQHLELEGIVDADFEPGTQQVLRRFKRLRVLTLKCADNTKCKLPISLGLLPSGLEQLNVRFAQLQGLSSKQLSLPNLTRLSLTNCAADNMRQFTAVLGGLRGLTGLRLENMIGLNDDHVAALSSLTQLTSLAVMAVSNQDVTNASLGALKTLTGLRKLTWHVGDMLDFPPDVVTLKVFSKLLLLSLTTSMFYRLSRWGALHVMDFLPYCQVDTVGP